MKLIDRIDGIPVVALTEDEWLLRGIYFEDRGTHVPIDQLVFDRIEVRVGLVETRLLYSKENHYYFSGVVRNDVDPNLKEVLDLVLKYEREKGL